MKEGDVLTLHELANSGVDTQFKVIGGWAIYEGIDYPRNNPSGWWVTISRMTAQGIRVRRIHTDTQVQVVQILNK